MNISGYITELKIVMTEETQIKTHLKKIRARRAKIEESISKYLEKSPDAGIKTNEFAISIVDKEFRRRKKKSDKIEEAANMLKRSGVPDADHILDKVIDALRGEIEVRPKLHIKKI